MGLKFLALFFGFLFLAILPFQANAHDNEIPTDHWKNFLQEYLKGIEDTDVPMMGPCYEEVQEQYREANRGVLNKLTLCAKETDGDFDEALQYTGQIFDTIMEMVKTIDNEDLEALKHCSTFDCLIEKASKTVAPFALKIGQTAFTQLNQLLSNISSETLHDLVDLWICGRPEVKQRFALNKNLKEMFAECVLKGRNEL